MNLKTNSPILEKTTTADPLRSEAVIVIGGPTASGKTALAIQLAEKYNTEIISADARQCYREMRIGTAVPTYEELNRIKHHFIQSHSIHQPLSAGAYACEARPVLENLLKLRGKAIVCGGSGLYIDALLFGFDTLPSDDGIRKNLEETYAAEGLQALLQRLEAFDPLSYQKVDKQNKMRIIRLLEIAGCTGKRPSDLLLRPKRNAPASTTCCFLNIPREILYRRIEARTDAMIEAGLEAEARSLYPFRHLPALQTVGYQELFAYFENSLTLEVAISKIKQHTRNYAKRQITWFKNHKMFSDCNFLG